MKANILYGINDIRYEETETPVPKEGEVLVRVMAAGICGSDVPRVYDTGAHKMPLIIGHEFSGEVVSAGSDRDSEWIGKRVGVFPLIPCGKCGPCKAGKTEMCRNYNYIGSRCNGAFAEYVTVPVTNLIELPESVSFEEAAMLEPMAVAVHAIRRGTEDFKLDHSSSVVVCGLGTIGLLTTMFLLDAGYNNLFLIGNKEFQRKRALEMGIPEKRYFDSKKIEDLKDALKYKEGADLFFECVGRNDTINLAIDMSAPSGRIVMVGNPFSDVKLERNTYWKILRNQLHLTGTWNSSFGGENDDWHYVIGCLSKKTINPSALISHRFSLDNLDKGLKIMRDKSEEYCKILVNQNDFASDSPRLNAHALQIIAEKMDCRVENIVDIEVLKKGMTNRSFIFRIERGRFAGKYIMRIPGEGTDQLIDRKHEAEVFRTISGQGLCDDPIYINPENGYKITRYLEGIRACDPNNEDDLRKCMKKLRSFHEMRLTVPHNFDIFGQIDFYEKLWDGLPSVYRDYEKTKEQIVSLKPIIDGYEKDSCLTHIDAVPDNFLFYKKVNGVEGLQLTDWEYSGMQDPHVDIAMFCIYSLYDKKQVDRLIDIYFENNCDDKLRGKIYCYVAMCGLLWSNWCEYKRNLGVEFGEYSVRQYRYAKEYYKYAVDLVRSVG